MKKQVKKAASKVKKDQEANAKKIVLQELFNDLYDNRISVYRMNFIRGIFFGLGGALGGTVLIALLVYALTLLSGIIPGLGDFFEGITKLLEKAAEA